MADMGGLTQSSFFAKMQADAISALYDWLINAVFLFNKVDNKKFEKFDLVQNDDCKVPCGAKITSCITKKGRLTFAPTTIFSSLQESLL